MSGKLCAVIDRTYRRAVPTVGAVYDRAQFMRGFFAGLMIVLLASWSWAQPVDTRLADAAMEGNREAVLTLLKSGGNVNAAQGDGATALHWAARLGDLEMIHALLKAGANVKAATRIGAITPLFMAAENGNTAAM